ncbi:hypothetical protein HPQ64_19345 [Rhizobiales bacterium]|uniref:hypothetical protein n=1 Tax=Hongsoonwoonella zoysiae TaxID=2821844 RepID=UPI0015616B75|nr:hypothetical protein [Hongsoonwoonella zoysiae]NRG19854.1 hypothetical protein [Hongsoonwoonella zoysiae]
MSLQDHAGFGAFSEPDVTDALKAEFGCLDAANPAFERFVLERLLTIKVFGGLPLHLPPLAPNERLERIRALLELWESGCRYAVDERLFADLLSRYRTGNNRPHPDNRR